MTRLLTLSSVLVAAALILLSAHHKPVNRTSKKVPISLHLVEPDHPFSTKGPVEVDVELKNISEGTILLCRELDFSANIGCGWKLSFHDPTGGTPLGWNFAGDKPLGQPEEFATALVRNWIALSPEYIYGTRLNVGLMLRYPLTPGTHKLSATFTSDGPNGGTVHNDSLHYPKEVVSLPYNGWKGEITSNEITLIVVASEK